MSNIIFRETISKAELETLYTKEKKTIKEIAQLFKTSTSTVSKTLRFFNIETRDVKSAQKSPLQEKLPRDVLYELYVTKQMSTGDISKLYNIKHTSSIVKLLRKYAIETRTSSEAVRTKTDISFFFNMNANLAYVLGLIATDGSIVNTTVKLGLNDRDVIEWIAEKISYSPKINYITTSSGNKNYRIAVQNKDLIEELAKYKLTERKTHTLQFPDIPTDMIRHFIRGVFDGDGSIHISSKVNPKTNNRNYKYCFSICTASLEFGEELKRVIEHEVGGDRKLIYDKSCNMYKYSIGGLESIYSLYKWLYKEDDFGMNRKKMKFQEIAEIYECKTKEAVS